MEHKGSAKMNNQCIGNEDDVVYIDDLDEDFIDEDVETDDNDDDVEFGEQNGSCCVEIKSCSNLVRRQLQREWNDMKKSFVKLNLQKHCKELFSMETLKQRLPILTWAPTYRYQPQLYHCYS